MLTKIHEAFSESYPAVAPSVPRARSVAAQFAAQCGIAGESLDAVRLAVTEAVTNTVLHAYPEPTSGTFQLTVAVAGDELWVLVSDDGCGYQTPSEHPGLGLGLTLIAQFSEEFVITLRATGGTEVRMRFPIPPGEPASV